ncbi:hypothetical protein ASCCphi28_gp20 [Lactococcus phage asccphi28]|nr:hypothetical protein ASCCphi28_gp20 [Lactococcus phage asccphi28]ACA21493.1 unknown [Lactococcus phage asccphi28]
MTLLMVVRETLMKQLTGFNSTIRHLMEKFTSKPIIAHKRLSVRGGYLV